MIPSFFAIHTVTIHEPEIRRELGKEVRRFGIIPDRIVEGCYIKSGPADEILTEEEREITEYTISLPPGDPVTRSARVSFEYGGMQHSNLEVVAPPRRPSGPTGYLDRTAIAVATEQEAKSSG